MDKRFGPPRMTRDCEEYQEVFRYGDAVVLVASNKLEEPLNWASLSWLMVEAHQACFEKAKNMFTDEDFKEVSVRQL